MLLALVITGGVTVAIGVGVALLYIRFPVASVIGGGTALVSIGVLLLLFGCLCRPKGCGTDADCIHGICGSGNECSCAAGWTGHDCTTRSSSS